MAKKPTATAASTGNPSLDAYIKQLYPDVSQATSAAGGYGLYNSIVNPAFQQSQMFNYQLPTYATDPNILNQGEMLARLRAESFTGRNDSPDVQRSMRALQQLARPGLDYIAPEQRESFNAAKSLAMNDSSSPIAIAQRQQLNQSLNSGLQTGLRAAGASAAGRGLVGGAATASLRPILQDYNQARSAGQTNLQLGNLQSYYGKAGEIDNAQFARKQSAINNYNNAAMSRDAFNEARVGQRLDRYTAAQDNIFKRYDTLGAMDKQTAAGFKAGELGSIFGGGGIGQQADAQAAQEALYKKAAAAAGGGGGGSFTPYSGGSSGSSGGSGGGTGFASI